MRFIGNLRLGIDGHLVKKLSKLELQVLVWDIELRLSLSRSGSTFADPSSENDYGHCDVAQSNDYGSASYPW